MARVTFPDNSVREFPDGTTSEQIARSLGPKLGEAALAAEIDGAQVDLTRPLSGDVRLKIITDNSPEGLEILRHSGAHLLAQAVLRLFPKAKLAIGPPIEDGFYYDMEVDPPFNEDDLAKLDAEMQKIIAENHPVQRLEVDRAAAVKMMQDAHQDYKVELLNEMTEPTVSFYRQGEFIDLCRGPHLPRTGRMKAIKILKTTGAYWRADEKNKMLQRVYGTAWSKPDDLKAYLTRLEEAKKRDHRRLGTDLDLFSIHQEVGGGLVHFHPKGAIIRHLIETEWKEMHLRRGYQLAYTPHIASEEIYKISGHLQNYSDLMYSAMDIDGRPFRAKPMNCPGHIMIYKTRLRSHRDLPIRLAELGTVYRYERAGVLHGLMRVRGFTIDDAHIFCRPDQVESEVLGVFDLITEFLGMFGFKDFDIYLSTRPEKSVGSAENWEMATQSLRHALETRGIKFQIDEGGGAFYGPKIDVKVKDAIGRLWQCSTIQFDFNLPERFNIEYRSAVSEAGVSGVARPMMVHRAVLGSIERFIGVLLEHYAGALPLWLAPVQVAVLPVSDKNGAAAETAAAALRDAGLRVEIDSGNERLGAKIRNQTLQKVPYLAVVGEREAQAGLVAVRTRTGQDLGALPVAQFTARLIQEVKSKAVTAP